MMPKSVSSDWSEDGTTPDQARVQLFRKYIMLNVLKSITFLHFDRVDQKPSVISRKKPPARAAA
jgi:hypothetical protein